MIIVSMFAVLLIATYSTTRGAAVYKEGFETVNLNKSALYCPVEWNSHFFGAKDSFAILVEKELGDADADYTAEQVMDFLNPDISCDGTIELSSANKCAISAANYGIPIQFRGIVSSGKSCNATPMARFGDALVDFALTRVITGSGNVSTQDRNVNLRNIHEDPACAFVLLSMPQFVQINGGAPAQVQDITVSGTTASLTLERSVSITANTRVSIDCVYMVHRRSIFPTELQMQGAPGVVPPMPTGWTTSTGSGNVTTINYLAPREILWTITLNPSTKAVSIVKTQSGSSSFNRNATFRDGVPNIASIAARIGMFKAPLSLPVQLRECNEYPPGTCISDAAPF